MDIISWLKCLLYILSLVVWRSGGGKLFIEDIIIIILLSQG